MAYQPKTHRKFLATSLTAAMVATAVAPTAGFAAGFADVKEGSFYYEFVTALNEAGIIDGRPDGSFDLGGQVTRAEAAKMIAGILKLDTAAAPSAGFTDVKADAWYAGYVNAVAEAGIVEGFGGKFDPNGTLTREAFAKIVVEAYDLKVKAGYENKFEDLKADAWYADYVNVLASNGLISGMTATKYGVGENVKRADFAKLLTETDWAVGDTLKKPAFEVTKVAAVNAKEITIEFNQAIDDVTAADAKNYELIVAGTTLTTSDFTVEVSDTNNNLVTIKLDDDKVLANNQAVQLKVKKAVLSGKLVAPTADFTQTWVFADTVAPSITKVEKSGSDVKVTFDDYVSGVELAKVNGQTKTVTVTALTKTVTLTNGVQNLGNGTYEVLLSGVTDAASNKSSVLTGSVVVSDDTVAPAVEKVEQSSDNLLKVKFNKEVANTPVFKVKKNGYELTATAARVDGDEFTLTLADNGQVKVYDAGQSSSSVTLEISNIKAVSNNLFGSTYTSNLTISKDSTAPTVVERFVDVVDVDSTATSDEVFQIRFNEDLSAVDASKITLTDKNGVRQNITGASLVQDPNNNNRVLQVRADAIRTSGQFAVGNFTLNLAAGAVKDLAGNNNAARSVTVAKSGTTADVTASATATANVITVSYGTEMTTSATAAANYMLDGKTLPAGTNIYFEGNTNTVKIELPVGSVTSTGAAVLTLSSNVESKTGSKVASANRTLTIGSGLVDNVAPVLTAAKRVNDTTVELTFSENVDGTVADLLNDFVVKINGTTVEATAVVDGTANDNKVSLTLPTYNTSQTVTVSVTETAADIDLVDLAGNKLTKATTVTAN